MGSWPNNCCCFQYADFMTCIATSPPAIQGYGFDTSVAPELETVSPPGGFNQYNRWTYAYLVPAPGHIYRDYWYRILKVTRYYTNAYKEIDYYEQFPWFYNAAANVQDFLSGTPPTSNPELDLRKNGFPLNGEAIEKHTTEGTIIGDPVEGNVLYGSLDQSLCPPPIIREDYMEQFYPANDPGTTGINIDGRTMLMRQTWEYSGKRKMSDVFDEAEALLEPLYEHYVDTRQGSLIFDYYKLDPCAHTKNSPGGTYDADGKFSFSVTPNQAFGILLGANEDTFNLWNDNVIYDDFSNAQGFPYYWGANDPNHVTGYDSVLFTYFKVPTWSGGTNPNGASIPAQKNSEVFVSRTGTVHVRGTPNTPVTLQYGPAHVNRLLVFKCGAATDEAPASVTVKTSFQEGALPLYFAGKNTADWSHYTGTLGGMIVCSSKIKIPANPPDLDVAYKAASVGDLLIWAPDLTLQAVLIKTFDYLTADTVFYTTLPSGESIFYPSDIQSPTTWGVIQSALAEWFAPVPPPNNSGNQNIGAGDNPSPL